MMLLEKVGVVMDASDSSPPLCSAISGEATGR